MKKFSWLNKNILGFGLASLLSDMAHETALALLPAFLTTLSGPLQAPQLLGIISGISDALASFSHIIFGILSDRWYIRKPFIVIGYALQGLLVGLWGFAPSGKFILLNKSIAWIGKGLREPARDALIAESVDKKYYGRAFGFHRSMDTLGAIIGPLMGWGLISFFSLRTLFLLTLIPSLGSVLAIIFLTHDVSRSKIAHSLSEPINSLKTLSSAFFYFASIMFIFSCGNFNRTLLMLYTQNTLSGNYAFITTTGFVLLLYTLFSSVRFVAEYSIGWLSDYSRKNYLLAFGGFGVFGIMNFFLLLPFKSLSFFIFLFVLAGISAATIKSLGKSYAAHLLVTHKATGYGFLTMLEGIGSLISSLVVGALWSYISPLASFLYAALLSLTACVLFLVFFKKSSQIV
jgi:MFS family permease